MKEEDRKALIEHRIAKADDAVRDVEFLIESKRLLLAVNRIYFGIFYIISALSLKKDFHTSKHQQLIGWGCIAYLIVSLWQKSRNPKIDGLYLSCRYQQNSGNHNAGTD